MILVTEDMITNIFLENCPVEFQGKKYEINLYKIGVGGSDPFHGPRIKIKRMGSKENFATIGLDINNKSIRLDVSKPGNSKDNKGFADAIDLAAALAEYDFDTFANYNENSKSENKAKEVCNNFSKLSKKEQKEYVKSGKNKIKR